MKWKRNEIDADGFPYDPTFINAAGGCPATFALNGVSRENDLRTLRIFRDEVLGRSPAGREIISIYYEWGPALVEDMSRDGDFKEEVQEMIEGFLGALGERE